MTDRIRYELRTSNGYVRQCRDREEAALAQLMNPQYRAVAVYPDGSEQLVY